MHAAIHRSPNFTPPINTHQTFYVGRNEVGEDPPERIVSVP